MEKFKNLTNTIKQYLDDRLQENDTTDTVYFVSKQMNNEEAKTPIVQPKEPTPISTLEEGITKKYDVKVCKRKFEGLGFVFQHKFLYDGLVTILLSGIYIFRSFYEGLPVLLIIYGGFLMLIHNTYLTIEMLNHQKYDDNFSAIYVVDMSIIWIFWQVYGILIRQIFLETNDIILLCNGAFLSAIVFSCLSISLYTLFSKKTKKITFLFLIFTIVFLPPLQLEIPSSNHIVLFIFRIVLFQVTYSQICMFIFYDRLTYRFYTEDNDKITNRISSERTILTDNLYNNFLVIIISSWPLFISKWILPLWIVIFTILTIKIVEIKTRVENQYGFPDEEQKREKKKKSRIPRTTYGLLDLSLDRKEKERDKEKKKEKKKKAPKPEKRNEFEGLGLEQNLINELSLYNSSENESD